MWKTNTSSRPPGRAVHPLRRLVAFLCEAAALANMAALAWGLVESGLTKAGFLPWPIDWEWLAWCLRRSPWLLLLLPLLPRMAGSGRSLGYRCMALGVVDGIGQPIVRRRAWVRSLDWWLCVLPFGLGLLPAWSKSRRTWADRINGTWVVDGQGSWKSGWCLLALFLSPAIGVHLKDRWPSAPPLSRRYGYLDRHATPVVPPRFKDAWDVAHGWSLVEDPDQGWGFFHPDGGRFQPLLGRVRPMFRTEDLVVATNGRGVCVLDERNTAVPIPASDDPRPGRTAGAPIKVQHGPKDVAYYDGQGRLVGQRHWQGGRVFVNGLACVSEGGQYGALDEEGHLAVPVRFDRLGPFAQGLASACTGSLRGLVDAHGSWVMRRGDLTDLLEVPEGPPFYLQASQEGRWGYLDFKGRWAIPPAFDEARMFSRSGYARVRMGPRWGVIDQAGRWVLPPVFEQMAAPEEAPFAAMKEGRWGYFDALGKELIPPVFAIAGPFKNGTAFARGIVRWYCLSAGGTVKPLPWGWDLPLDSLGADLLPYSVEVEDPR